MKVEFVGKGLFIRFKSGTRVLAIGDLHLGYEESLNYSGIFVTRGLFKQMIEELEEIFSLCGRVDEVVLLGDVRHSFAKVGRQERDDSKELFKYLKGKVGRIVIARGNHDTIIEPVARREGIEVVDVYEREGVAFVHGDKDWKEMHRTSVKMWVMGHGHPAVSISDGVKQERFKCFLDGKYKGKRVVIVPSFVSHSQGTDPRDHELGLAWDFRVGSFKVHVVGEKGKVYSFGKLKDLG